MLEEAPDTRAALAIARLLLDILQGHGHGPLAHQRIQAAAADMVRRDPEAAAFLPAVLARLLRP